MNNKWESTAMGNVILDCKTFFISYNPYPCIHTPFASDDNSDETALVDKNGYKYYILNGDFRKQYEKLVDKGFDACKKFYDSKKGKYNSSWTAI